MSQSKLESAIEKLVDTIIAFFLSVAFSPLFFWICGIDDNHIGQNASLVACFTVLSFVRSYIIRRYFNNIGNKK